MTAIQSTQPVKVMIYNTQPEDDQVEQIITTLIDWNAHAGFFKRNGRRVVSFKATSPLLGLIVGMYLDTTLYVIEKQLKNCVLYVSGHKARYGAEVKMPSRICKAVRDSTRFVDSLQPISDKEMVKVYAGGVS